MKWLFRHYRARARPVCGEVTRAKRWLNRLDEIGDNNDP